MAKIELTQKQRFALVLHLNPMPAQTRQDSRRMDRIWTALHLDDAGDRAAEALNNANFPWSLEQKEYEITSDQRDQLIEWLNHPMTNFISRILGPVYDALEKSRDGEKQ